MQATDLPQLTHRQLAMFRTLMRQGNLSRTAEVLNTSQPTLSRELARLEQVLGFALFDRIRGRLQPTAHALALLQEVERSFVGLEQIGLRARALRSEPGKRLRLACLPALAHALVPHALGQLRLSLPQAQVVVHPLESPWLEQALGTQGFDLGLSEAQHAPPGWQWQALFQADEVAVLPEGHPLCQKAVLELADFAGQPFISLAANDPYRLAIDSLFAQQGVARKLPFETDSAVAVCAMVRQGLGLAVVNPLTALACAGPGLQVRCLGFSLPFRISLLLPHDRATDPVRDAMVAALAEASTRLQTQAQAG